MNPVAFLQTNPSEVLAITEVSDLCRFGCAAVELKDLSAFFAPWVREVLS